MKLYYLLMPDSPSTMKLQEHLLKEGIKSTLAPTPREADHCCGVCILYRNPDDKVKIQEVLEREGIASDGFWEGEDRRDPKRNKFL